MELLDDVGQLEARFGQLGEIVNLNARLEHGLCQAYHWLKNHFGCTWLLSYVMWVKSKLVLICLEIVLISIQDRCTVCIEHAIGSKIVLGAFDRTPRWHGTSGSSFRSVWRLCYSRCKIGVGLRRMYHSMEIFLVALVGTPRWRWSNRSSFQSLWR
jgi:hypothetical protein